GSSELGVLLLCIGYLPVIVDLQRTPPVARSSPPKISSSPQRVLGLHQGQKDLIRPNQEGLASIDLDANPGLQSAAHCPAANHAFHPKLGQTSK
ncbi:hypothetical protein Taro_030859, partial [Colocasia esculenta]|nr:hypothetical protein [Colocasia esculenta]